MVELNPDLSEAAFNLHSTSKRGAPTPGHMLAMAGRVDWLRVWAKVARPWWCSLGAWRGTVGSSENYWVAVKELNVNCHSMETS